VLPQPQPEKFLTALERRLTPEQVMQAALVATGTTLLPAKTSTPLASEFHPGILRGPVPRTGRGPRPRRSKVRCSSSMILLCLVRLEPKPGNLMDRLKTLKDDAIADELYLSILTRTSLMTKRGLR
jgi:hypothetical protein